MLFEADELPLVPLDDVQEVSNYSAALKHGLARMRKLGMDDAAALLKATLAEEEATDEALTQLGESGVNAQAAQKQAA